MIKKTWVIAVLYALLGVLVGVFGTVKFVNKVAENKSKAAWSLGQEELEKGNFAQAVSLFNQSLAFARGCQVFS